MLSTSDTKPSVSQVGPAWGIVFAAYASAGLLMASMLSYGYFAADLLVLNGMDTLELAILDGGFALAFFYFGGAVIYVIDWMIAYVPPEYISPEWYEWTIFAIGIVLCTVGYAVTVYTTSYYTFTWLLAIGAFGGGIFYWNIWKLLPVFVDHDNDMEVYRIVALVTLITQYLFSAILSYVNLILDSTCSEGHSSWYCLYLGLTWVMFAFMFLTAGMLFLPYPRKLLKRYRDISRKTPASPNANYIEMSACIEIILFQIVFYASYAYVPLFARVELAYPAESVVVNSIATMDWGIIAGLIAAWWTSFKTYNNKYNVNEKVWGRRKNSTIWFIILLVLNSVWFACERVTHAFLPYAFFLGMALGGATYALYDDFLIYPTTVTKPSEDMRMRLIQFITSFALGQIFAVLIASFVVWDGVAGYMYLATVAMAVLLIMHLTTIGIKYYDRGRYES